MKTTTKTSPQGVEIEYIEFSPTMTEEQLRQARVINRVRLEQVNRRDRARSLEKAAQE